MATPREPKEGSTTQKILAYIAAHPGCTNVDIGKDIGEDPTSVAARTSQMTISGRLKRIPTSNKNQGPKWAYEIGDPSKPTAANKAMQEARQASKKTNGRHPNVITTKKQAQEYISQAKLDIEEQPKADQLLRRAELLVRSGADITDNEWQAICEAAGQTREELEARWAPKPEVQERFEVKTPLPEDPVKEPEEVVTEQRFEHPFMTLMRQTADAMAAALMDQFQLSVMKQMNGLPGQLVSIPPPIQALAPQTTTDAMPSISELAERLKTAPVAEKQKKQKVLIIGAKPANAGEISATFHDSFDFTFWFDESYDTLKEAARSADHCLVWLKGASHTAVDYIRAVGKKPIMITGGVTMVKEKLMDIYTAPAMQ